MTEQQYETLDAAKAVELLKAAVAERGERYVYSEPEDGCVYVADGAPSCLVGEALVAHGLPVGFFYQAVSYDKQFAAEANGLPMSLLHKAGVLPFVTARARAALTAAQNVQDQGCSWGDALERAEREALNTAYSDELPS